MAAENNFRTTVESLFKGMDSFITTKTVVGEAITVGDTIILPLVDVSFGVGAGAFAEEKKNNGGGRYGRKDFSQCGAGHFRRCDKTGEYQESGRSY